MLPLGKQSGKRAGQQPEKDAQAFPLKGDIVECVTGESVVVRRKPDLDALRQALQVLPLAPAVCGAGTMPGRWDSTACCFPVQPPWQGAAVCSRCSGPPGKPSLVPCPASEHCICGKLLLTGHSLCPVQAVLDEGIKSLAVVLKHAAIFPDHEKVVGNLAKEMGFQQISLSSVVMSMVKMVPRGFTACADAYLTPHIMR